SPGLVSSPEAFVAVEGLGPSDETSELDASPLDPPPSSVESSCPGGCWFPPSSGGASNEPSSTCTEQAVIPASGQTTHSAQVYTVRTRPPRLDVLSIIEGRTSPRAIGRR